MAQVHFGFTDEMKLLIKQGRKSCTTRVIEKRKKGDTTPSREPRCKVDDTFDLDGETYRVIAIKRRCIQDVRVSHLQEEGFRDTLDENGEIIERDWEKMVKMFSQMGFPQDEWGRQCVVYFFAHVSKE